MKMGDMIYLDNHSSSLACRAALEGMMPYLQEPYKMSSELSLELAKRSEMIFALAGAKEPDRFVFTACNFCNQAAM